MKFFTKNEFIGVLIILGIILAISFQNMRIASRRARDAQRRSDLGAIRDALASFNEDFGYFPPATDDGRIKMCKGEGFEEFVEYAKDNPEYTRQEYFGVLEGCDWGQDPLHDPLDSSFPDYMETLPIDPRHGQGNVYKYYSNSKRFQIYAHLEGEEDAQEYDTSVVSRGIYCGDFICNFGKAAHDTPIDISIDEYERILKEKEQETGSQ